MRLLSGAVIDRIPPAALPGRRKWQYSPLHEVLPRESRRTALRSSEAAALEAACTSCGVSPTTNTPMRIQLAKPLQCSVENIGVGLRLLCVVRGGFDIDEVFNIAIFL